MEWPVRPPKHRDAPGFRAFEPALPRGAYGMDAAFHGETMDSRATGQTSLRPGSYVCVRCRSSTLEVARGDTMPYCRRCSAETVWLRRLEEEAFTNSQVEPRDA